MDTHNLFRIGVSFDDFVNKDMDSYREKTLEVFENIHFDEEHIEKIKRINKKIYILICAEMWCPDCMINVPVIEKIRQYNDNISLSIVGKDGNEGFFRKYTLNDNVKIPTFVIFDANFNELGSFVEHPHRIKEIITKGNQANIIVTMRKYRKGEYAQETLNDILSIII